jgi:hypothetical protein
LREIDGFSGCKSLCRIEIPWSVEVINFYVFQGCTSLNEIVFSSDTRLREILWLWECTSLYRIQFPSSLENMEYVSFSRCTSLRVVIIRAGCRLKRNQRLRAIKPFLVHEENNMKKSRNLIHLAFGRRWLQLG